MRAWIIFDSSPEGFLEVRYGSDQTMEFLKKSSYEEMSLYAAAEIEKQILQKPDSVLCLPTGSTPVGVYEKLTDLYRMGRLSFADCVTFNLDEYYPIRRDDPNSFRAFMYRHLFDRVDVPDGSIHIPDGEAKDAKAECRRYDLEIERHGRLDLAVLGVGENGHIGFNEPADELGLDTHLATLSESTRAANKDPFETIDRVPKEAITMGLSPIFLARRVLVLVSGSRKTEIVRAMLGSTITPRVPATLLRLHHSVTVVVDSSIQIT